MGFVPVYRQIVLAEDNPADVGLVREALREHNVQCELQVISDGEEMLAFIDRLDADHKLPCPDLLLLDLSLPKYDGQQVLKHLRASGRCGRTPVVVMTSALGNVGREKGDGEAVHYYFEKPCSLTQFLQLGTIVKQVMDSARPV